MNSITVNEIIIVKKRSYNKMYRNKSNSKKMYKNKVKIEKC